MNDDVLEERAREFCIYCPDVVPLESTKEQLMQSLREGFLLLWWD